MRVLNVSAFIDPVIGGGTAERTVQLSRAMARGGLEVEVLATDAGLRSSRRNIDVGAARLRVLRCLNERFLVPRWNASSMRACIGRADIVHLCTHWTLLNWLVYRAAIELGRPYVICPAGALPTFGRSRLLKRVYNTMGGRALVERASAWVAITQREIEDFVPYGVDSQRVDVVPNGIEPGDFAVGDQKAFRAAHGIGERSFVLFMGRLNPIKGPDILLEAFASVSQGFPDHALVFAGPDGGMQAELKRRAAAHGLASRVLFPGWLGGGDRSAAYKAADLVVIPSRQEAMSLVVLEAGACGKPVLMTDRCGFDEATAGGGVVAVPPEASSLAAALKDLLLRDDLEQMGLRLQGLVKREYSWEIAVTRYRAIFERVLAGRRS